MVLGSKDKSVKNILRDLIGRGELRIYQDNVKPDELNKLLIQNGVNVSGIFETGISLEDYFKSLVGEGSL